MENRGTIEQWMGPLTRAGFDLMGVTGWTSRNEPGLPYDQCNQNLPMLSLTQHYRWKRKANKRANSKTISTDLVLSMYSTNSSFWTIYAIGCSGDMSHKLRGFIIRGRKEKEISSLEDLKAWIASLEGVKEDA